MLVGLLAAAAARPAHAEKYSILTYNTGLLRVLGFDLVPAVVDRSRAAARELAAFAAEHRPDIIFLQEVWKNSAASAIAKELAPLGYACIRPKGCGLLHIGSGLLLLVRPPLEVVDWSFTLFTERPGIEVVTRKGIFAAVLEDAAAGGSRFALVGVHTAALDTIDGRPRVKSRLDALLDQAGQVLTVLDSISSAGQLPAVLLGDFNVGPGYADEGYRAIAGAPGIVEAGEQRHPELPLVTWDPLNPLVRLGRYPGEPAAKIDHIFLRGGGSRIWQVNGVRRVLKATVAGIAVRDPGAGVVVAAPLSDHYGLLAEVELAGIR
jgi:endonuclease/exonuclease/phosphatase family metal-dependent hydrolase